MRASIRAKFEQFHMTGIPVESGSAEQFFTKPAQPAPAASIDDLVSYATAAECLDDPSRVYFMRRDDGCVKIGISRNPSKRADDIRQVLASAGHPSDIRILAVIRGGRTIEKYLHRVFRDLRIAGEWFTPDPSLVAFITEIRAEIAAGWAEEAAKNV